MRRAGSVAPLAASLVVLSMLLAAPRAAADEGNLSGAIPEDGGVALVVYAGGPFEALAAAAAEQGCSLTSAFVPRGRGFAGYIVGAPTFVNDEFTSLFSGDLPPATALIIVCAAEAPAARAALFEYVVQPHDSLASIAGRFGVTVDELVEVNDIGPGSDVEAGVELQIPADGSSNQVIGVSVRGRPIEVTCSGSGGRTVLLVGGLHVGYYETVTSQLALEVAEALWSGDLVVPRGMRVCLVPTLNVDGLALRSRTNARGVDLNRNWPSTDWTRAAYHPEGGAVSGGSAPLSEPETRALYNYIADVHPVAVIAWHCCASVVEGNARATGLADEYADAAGLQRINDWTAYRVSGQLIDALEDLGLPGLDVELERRDASRVDRHLEGIRALLARLAPANP